MNESVHSIWKRKNKRRRNKNEKKKIKQIMKNNIHMQLVCANLQIDRRCQTKGKLTEHCRMGKVEEMSMSMSKTTFQIGTSTFNIMKYLDKSSFKNYLQDIPFRGLWIVNCGL